MFRINNNDFKILNKYKDFMNEVDNLLENVPRKDLFYKDKIRTIELDLLQDILKCSYQEDISNINFYKTNIKAYIATIDFLLDRLYIKQYISEKSLYKVGNNLVEINKMINGWLKNLS